MIKIVLIEDQNLLSTTLIRALNQSRDMKVVGLSDKAGDAMELCKKYNPNVVLMDIFTKDGNGIERTVQLKRAFPDIKVLIMTGVEDDRLVKAAEEAGADLFVWKNLSLEELAEFIRNANMPYRIFPQVRIDALETIKFSEMELRILRLLAQGKTSHEIASELFLAGGTVRLYISRMYAETGLKSRAQLVAHALRYGLIAIE